MTNGKPGPSTKGPGSESMPTDDGSTVHGPADQIRRRQYGALRCEPIRLGLGLSRLDPWLVQTASPGSSFGLRRHELLAEVVRCREDGWQSWEIVERFADPRTVGA